MTLDIHIGIKNIVEGQGVSIALTGMLIVFIALGLITFSISIFPKTMGIIEKVFPHKIKTRGIKPDSSEVSDETLVAIGSVLYKSLAKNQATNNQF
jgi:hypothetical protein